jgi:hypothetical protein
LTLADFFEAFAPKSGLAGSSSDSESSSDESSVCCLVDPDLIC